jgi:PAS domain S-box-containing protein
MMHATLESTTDAILVTDEANYFREFNEKYIGFWGIPPYMMVSAHVTELWNYISPQLKDPAGYLARVNEIVASSVPETFDVLELKDGRVLERNSAIQLIKQRNVGRVWSFRDITQRKRAQDALANEKRVLEKIAAGAPLATVLDVLVRGVEALSCDGMMCTVLIFDEAAQCLRHGAASSLPEEYNQLVKGIGIGPRHWMDSDRFAFYLLDVSGHGVKSALLAVSIIDTLRTCGLAQTDWNDPGEVLQALNRVYFSHSHDHLYFTIWYGIADLAKEMLCYAGGGHPPAVVCAAGCENPTLPASGPPVGCFAKARYPTLQIPLRFPTELYLFSDGVFEARRHHDDVPLDRLVEFLVTPRDGHVRSVSEIRNRALEHLHGTPPPDDCSVLKVALS